MSSLNRNFYMNVTSIEKKISLAIHFYNFVFVPENVGHEQEQNLGEIFFFFFLVYKLITREKDIEIVTYLYPVVKMGYGLLFLQTVSSTGYLPHALLYKIFPYWS